MGLKECVLGLFVLVAFDHVYSARLMPRMFQPRVLTEKPQSVDSHLREQWSPIQGLYEVQSQRPQLNPLTTDLAPSSIQSKQELQGPVRELTWKFPKVPEEPVQPYYKFELQQPQPSDSVAVQCWENGVHVEVKQELLWYWPAAWALSSISRRLCCSEHGCSCQSPDLSIWTSWVW